MTSSRTAVQRSRRHCVVVCWRDPPLLGSMMLPMLSIIWAAEISRPPESEMLTSETIANVANTMTSAPMARINSPRHFCMKAIIRAIPTVAATIPPRFWNPTMRIATMAIPVYTFRWVTVRRPRARSTSQMKPRTMAAWTAMFPNRWAKIETRESGTYGGPPENRTTITIATSDHTSRIGMNLIYESAHLPNRDGSERSRKTTRIATAP